MTTVTLDILDDKAINLLKDLESLKVIRLHQIKETKTELSNLAAKYSGAMTKQPIEEIDKQLNDLRNEWD
jgi:hypothetical protein